MPKRAAVAPRRFDLDPPGGSVGSAHHGARCTANSFSPRLRRRPDTARIASDRSHPLGPEAVQWLQLSVEDRARLSAGGSAAIIHASVVAALNERAIRAAVDSTSGCGTGASGRTSKATAIDTSVPTRFGTMDFQRMFSSSERNNLDAGSIALPDGSCDVVACVETIEHVENPRALMRELVRLARPGGWLVVTTPNQLSVLSKLGLLTKNEFVHFQERPGLYPAHISALLEIDLLRMCRENQLEQAMVRYSGQGRIPFTARNWPHPLRSRSGALGRAFSDNVLVIARKPA